MTMHVWMRMRETFFATASKAVRPASARTIPSARAIHGRHHGVALSAAPARKRATRAGCGRWWVGAWVIVLHSPRSFNRDSARWAATVTAVMPGRHPPLPSPLAVHWQHDPSVCYLNHGSFGACPTVVLHAQQRLRNRTEAEQVRF